MTPSPNRATLSRMHRRRPRGLGQYSPPDYFDAGWANIFVAGCEAIGANPLDVAGIIIGESGWNPSAKNPSGAAGLNQIAPGNYGIFSGDYTLDQFLNLTVSAQLPYCFQYWQNVMANAGLSTISGRDLYWLNWLPSLYVTGASDDYIIQSRGDPYYSADLDIGGKGYITAGDLQTRIDNMKASQPSLYAYLEQQICLAGGCFGDTQTLVFAAFATGFAGFFAWNWWKTGRLV